MATIDQALQEGLKFHNSGDFRQAEQLYRQVLQANPRHAQAMHLLGMIAFQVGQHQVAVQYCVGAIRLNGGDPQYHATLGEALRNLGQFDDAVASYRQALRLKPDYAAAHNNLGTVLQGQGCLSEAIAAYREALRLVPEYADAHFNLAGVLQQQGNFSEAVHHFRETLKAKPGETQAKVGLALSLRSLEGQWSDEAVGLLESAVEQTPAAHMAHSALGVAYHARRQLARAVVHYRRALELFPNFPAGHYNLATALRDLDELPLALSHFREAIRGQENFAEAHLGLASVYNGLVFPDEAVAAARRALELNPQAALAAGQLAYAYQLQGEMDLAIAEFRHALLLNSDDAVTHSNLLYTLNFQPQADLQALFEEHRTWAARHAEPHSAAAAPHANDRSPERRLRIGYVSAHFREHAVSFFSEPLLAFHDKSQFEVYGYADVQRGDAVTARFRGQLDAWRDIHGMSDDDVAQLVRRDQIDILVDLAGHIGGQRLLVFARKPAPLQVTYLGYQNTTGMSAMDYRLTDAHADPEGQTERYYSEELLRLPRRFFCYAPPEPAPAVNPSPALAAGHVTFASLNHINKLTRPAIETWAEILTLVPNAHLIVLAYARGRLERTLREIMASASVDQNRVKVVNKRPRFDYLQLHHCIDIALDTFPFNGHTTVCDALWMGVPSVMLEGDRYSSRFGGGTLLDVGLGDWIAHSRDEYIEIARRWAADTARLAALRGELRERMQASPLVDAAAFARDVEAVYRRIWRRWCAGG